MMVELDADKETTFTLEMEIEGHVGSGEKPEMRFCLELADFTMSIKADRIENGVYQITCPKLKGLCEAGSYKANIEVIIGDKRFVPLTEMVTVKQDLKPIVKMTEAKVEAKPAFVFKAATKVAEKVVPTLTKTEIISR